MSARILGLYKFSIEQPFFGVGVKIERKSKRKLKIKKTKLYSFIKVNKS